MKQSGTIQKWNDEKGFGFIKPELGNREFFFHIKSFRNGGNRPAVGMRVNFEPGEDSQGRMQANNVRVSGSDKEHPALIAFVVAAIFLSGVGFLSTVGYVPKAILWLYIATSVLSFMFYFIDKSAAQMGRRRTSEATLHNLALIGGWPGALFAQQLLRHKSKKESFRSTFRVTIILNLMALLYLLSPYGDWLSNKISMYTG